MSIILSILLGLGHAPTPILPGEVLNPKPLIHCYMNEVPHAWVCVTNEIRGSKIVVA